MHLLISNLLAHGYCVKSEAELSFSPGLVKTLIHGSVRALLFGFSAFAVGTIRCDGRLLCCRICDCILDKLWIAGLCKIGECEGLIAHGWDLYLFLRLAPREMELKNACCQAVLGFKAFIKLFKYCFVIQFVIFLWLVRIFLLKLQVLV